MEDTGERMIPARHKGMLIYGEHAVRYESISPLLVGKDVLDIASGSGYGTKMLARHARGVTGVDNSAEAIAFSNKHYAGKNIRYQQGDAVSIPLPDAGTDAVVSFETIEHIKDYRRFLAEIKRVLRPGGLAIISTPNVQEFPSGNHFHEHEFEPSELESLLGTYFKNVSIYYQGDWQYSAILSARQFETEWKAELMTSKAVPDSLARCIYMVVVCSDAEIPALVPIGIIAQQSSVKADIQRHGQREDSKETLIEALAETEAELAKTRRSLNTVLSSKSWRYTQLVRNVKTKLTKKRN